jgi:intracellular multiplication protein IcmJ
MAIKLSLSGELNNWEKFKARKKSKTFNEISNKILRRDKETCRFCGYQGQTLEVINYDGNYKNNTARNFITACVLCARCTLLDHYKLDYTGGDRIIYLPELSQGKLNALCQILFAEAAGDANSEGTYNAKSVLAQLLDRANFLDETAGCQLSHPGLFLYYLNGQKKNADLISKLRWLPDPLEYPDAIKIWRHEMNAP